jgi:arylsulfatase
MQRRTLLTGASAHAWAAARRPNLLFLFPDQLRHDWVEPAPVKVRTPHVRALAARGLRFTNAFTPSPLCAPARACLASGRQYGRAGVASNAQNYPLAQPTFYQALRDSGYHVMGCGKFDLHKPELDWGTDGKRLIRDWGFSEGVDSEGKHDGVNAFVRQGKPMGPYMAYLERVGASHAHVEDFEKRKKHNAVFPTTLSDEHYCDNWIGRNGLELIDRAPRDKPWFLQVNFNGPHSPWDITASMEKRWRGIGFPQPNRCREFTPAEHEAIRQNYAAMIENIDRHVGLYVDKLKQRGELENTLIVFSSDHGEMLGDHNLWGKTKPHQGSAAVPLVVAGPGVVRNKVTHHATATLDLSATFIDYAQAKRPEGTDSVSLRPQLTGRASVRPHVTSALGPWRIAVREQFKLVEGYTPEPQLFDLRRDPQENENLAAERPALVRDLKQALA